MARGEGSGDGQGDGQGGVSEDGVVMGSAVAVGLTVCMCVLGIPMLLIGVIIIIFFPYISSAYSAGIALVVISVVFCVVGIIFIILLCTGVIEKKNSTGVVHQNTTVVMSQTHTHAPPPGYQHQPVMPPPYQGAPPGYPGGPQPNQQPGGPPPPGYNGGPGAPPIQQYPPPGYTSTQNEPVYPPATQQRY